MRHEGALEHLLSDDGVILTREHPEAVRCALKRSARAGRLARVLPGVYVAAAAAGDLATRVTAVARWDPSAVICGRAAAALTYWPEVKHGPIEVASTVRHAPQPGFRFTQRSVPPELVILCRGVRLTSPSLTAVELADFEFTDPIDIALRRRAASLRSLRAALAQTPHRRGNAERWQVLLDSRAEPWSAAERLAHRLYRRAGIDGWVANHKVVIRDWGTYYLDAAFRRQRVASEIDGLVHLDDRRLFETDRLRQNALVLEGWLILRFTWLMLTEDPRYVIDATRRALAERDRFPRLNGRTARDTPSWTG